MRGKIILSCGHESEHGCMGVSVQFDEEQCVAGEGFVPTTIYAQYCHECATKLYESRIAALIEAGDRLAGFAGHGKRSDGEECSFAWVGAPCDCGLDEAVKQWKEVRGE